MNQDINARFAELEKEGLVRFRVEPDDDFNYGFELESEEETKAIQKRIEREGAWGIISEYLDNNNCWQHVYSCWGFIGNDWEGSGYDIDAKRDAIDALAEYTAVQYNNHATFAAG